jgi:hypothetical protein
MEYSSKAADLFHPELRPPLFLQPGLRWNAPALCAELSRLAYFHFEEKSVHETEVRDACKAVGLQPAKFFNDPDTNTQAFAVLRASDGHAFVAFRGTQPDKLRDCLTDAQALLQPWREAQRVHAGFLQAYRRSAIKDGIEQQLQAWRRDYPQLKVSYTGHSLGAALATLAAADAPGSTLMTFGSPRVGNDAFADSFTGITAVSRYVDCCDVVTEVPIPIPLLLPYEHLAGRHYIDSHRKVWATQPDADVEQDRRSVGIDAFALPQFFAAIHAAQHDTQQGEVPRLLSDHAIINYILPLLALPST